MVRIGFVLYLALTTAAGPWLCCCSPPRPAAAADPVRPAESVPSCCRHESAVPADSQSSQPSPKPTEGCPCPHHPTQALLAAAPEKSDAVGVHVLYGATWFVAALGDAPAVVQLDAPARRIDRFLTGRDLLRAIHVLRC